MKSTLIFKVFSALVIAGMILAGAGTALAAPPPTTAPTIDGVINLVGEGWDNVAYPAGTRLVADPNNDSAWGTDNEILNVYINWDATNLYLAVDYNVSGNGMILYLDFGSAAGITDFDSPTDYGWNDDVGPYIGAWPRNITFPVTNGIDAFYAAWDGASGIVYTANGATNSTDITGSSVVAATKVGTHTNAEISIPWLQLGFPSPVYPGAGVPVVNVLAAIVGGDDYSAPDTGPNVASANGAGNPVTVLVTEFAVAGVGPTAITLSNLTATRASYVMPAALAAALILAGGLFIWKRRK